MSTTDPESSNQQITKTAEPNSLQILGGKLMFDKAGTGFAIPYHKTSSQTKKDSYKPADRTSLEILNSKRVWDKAGTSFSMPYQKPSKSIKQIETKKGNHENSGYPDDLQNLLLKARKSLEK